LGFRLRPRSLVALMTLSGPPTPLSMLLRDSLLHFLLLAEDAVLDRHSFVLYLVLVALVTLVHVLDLDAIANLLPLATPGAVVVARRQQYH